MSQPKLRKAQLRRMQIIIKELFSKRLTRVAFFILALWGLSILFAPLIATHNPNDIDLPHRLEPMSQTHIFGTDSLGRDIWSRIVYGGRRTFLSIMLTAVIAAPLGLFIGMLAGYIGGLADLVISRIIDLFFAIPRLILALVFVAVFGPGFLNAVFAVALTSWPAYARVARSEVLSLRNTAFIQVAQLQGASNNRILYRYLLPMCQSSMLIRLSMDLGGIILSIAGIGFLGLGTEPPLAEWGAMAAEGRAFLLNQWWISVIPGIAIFTVSLCFNCIGNELRRILDPKREVACL